MGKRAGSKDSGAKASKAASKGPGKKSATASNTGAPDSAEVQSTVMEDVAPLGQALMGGRAYRLIAGPTAVTIDGPGGIERIDVDWSAQQHQVALDGLTASDSQGSDYSSRRVGNSVLVERPPDPLRHIDALAEEGKVSDLAARMLDHALKLGRNILCIGPWAPCVELASALVASGGRPCIFDPSERVAPRGWHVAGTLEALRSLGPDRAAAWHLDMTEVVELMGSHNGVVAWADCRSVERALIRFELAAKTDAPLHVLAGIDVLVVIGGGERPKVRSITEITMAADGYVPRTLFSTGAQPLPHVLVPIAPPTFLQALDEAGYGVLADELQHATESVPAPQAPEGADAVIPEYVAPPIEPPPHAVERVAPPQAPALRPTFAREPNTALDPSLLDGTPPGWELDQLSEEQLDEQTEDDSADGALIAATFGLAPPPRPAGVKGDPAGGPEQTATFQEALAVARERDEAMQRELESDSADSHGSDLGHTDDH